MTHTTDWFYPTDPKLKVLQVLPDGVAEHKHMVGPREAWGKTEDGVFRRYYFCSHCGGWIEGEANFKRENTLDSGHLSGRNGLAWYCRRCGLNFAFYGTVS